MVHGGVEEAAQRSGGGTNCAGSALGPGPERGMNSRSTSLQLASRWRRRQRNGADAAGETAGLPESEA
jgi:hypothetical protein